VQKLCPVLGLVFLAACSHGNEDKEAVRKAIQDRLAGMGMPASQVTVKINTVEFKNDSAVANVSVIPKGQDESAGMKLPYQLQYKDGKWAVTGRADGGAGHGGSAPASGPSGTPGDPHGGAMPVGAAPQGTPTMPSPDSLPPATKKPGKGQ
jgi:hypothetical protein